MYYLVESDKTFEQASTDLELAFVRFGFLIRFAHNLGDALRNKSLSFNEQCKIFEACIPELLPEINLANSRQVVPARIRITVFTENGKTKIVFNQMMQLSSALSKDSVLAKALNEIEKQAVQLVEEVK